MKHKFSLKGYWDKTPKVFRKLGDALLAVALMVEAGKAMDFSITSVLTEKEVHYIAIGAVIGKILTNFFKDGKSES